MDLERQYEIAMTYDCYGPWARLTRLVGVPDTDLEAADAGIEIPTAVRPAYRDWYRRGVTLLLLAEEREITGSDVVEVSRLVTHMEKGGI
jgi:hypothetical protein